MAQPRNPCPLCLERKPLNDEDVLPDWARSEAFDIFPPPEARSYPPRIKLRICIDCNTTMARRYEDRVAPLVKPMMWGKDRHLTEGQQAHVGRWMLKTSLLLGILKIIESGGDPGPTRQTLVHMLDVDVPPDGSSVRIGRFTAGKRMHNEKARMAKLLPGGAPKGLVSAGVSSFANVVFEHLMGDPRSIDSFVAGTKRSDRLIRIWPPQVEGVDFPPPHVFTGADMAALRAAYRLPRATYTRYAAGRD